MIIDIDDLKKRIDKADDITCYCPKCHKPVTMQFDADCIWSEGMEDEIWWNHYVCPNCHEFFDDSNRGMGWTRDILDYNSKLS